MYYLIEISSNYWSSYELWIISLSYINWFLVYLWVYTYIAIKYKCINNLIWWNVYSNCHIYMLYELYFYLDSYYIDLFNLMSIRLLRYCILLQVYHSYENWRMRKIKLTSKPPHCYHMIFHSYIIDSYLSVPSNDIATDIWQVSTLLHPITMWR